MYKLGFYVPQSHLEQVKEALFDAGAGRIGDYEKCCWQALGQGQFLPLSGSEPYLGTPGEVHRVAEFRVELVCAADCVRRVVAALQAVHPYEEPAWDLVELVTELP